MGALDRVFRSRRPSQERPHAAIIAGLWRNGEQGARYEAGDLSTMFQDAAGTLPVYAPGSGQVDPPVGRILDKSGRGNHAYQTTTTSRPTLSARYNMLVSTEQLSSAAWVKLNTGTGLLPTVTDAAAVSPRGTLTASRIVLNKGAGATTSDQSAIFQNVQIASGVIARRGVWLRTTADTGTINIFLDSTGGAGFGVVVTVTPAWQYFSVTNDTDSNNGRGIRLSVRGGFGTSDSADILAWGFDVRPANDGVGLPPYQRVVDANTYDTAGFPLYLRFDGVDDFLQTANVDFSGTDKLFVSAAIRKLSDAATGCLVELSGWSGVSGGVSIQAPRTAGSNLSVALRDASNVAQYSINNVASPASLVLSAKLNISAVGIENQIAVRMNGGLPSLSVSSSATVVASAFANGSLYIGRRAGTLQPFIGRLYSLLIRGVDTPDATIAKVERYVNSKARIY